MNADAFRHFYNYHFAENRKIWNHVASLPQEQFTQVVGYSHGSVRDQVIHFMDCEDTWFSELQSIEPRPLMESDAREIIRAQWDKVEQRIRDYLAKLQDDILF